MTRAHFSTILLRLISDAEREYYWTRENQFTDISSRRWYNNAISTVTNMGIYSGFPDNTFRPGNYITRAEFTAGMIRFLDVPLLNGDEHMFTDITNHWANNYVNTLAEHGWTAGIMDIGGNFLPDQPVTRAEAAALILRMLRRVPQSIDNISGDIIMFTDNRDPRAWYYLYIIGASNSYYFIRYSEDCAYIVLCSIIYPSPQWHLLEREDSEWDHIRR